MRGVRTGAGSRGGRTWWRPVNRPTPTTTACADTHTGPHNRCEHPTPPPPGYHRCAADTGCPIVISDRSPLTLCWSHLDDDTHLAGLYPYRDLLEATP